MIIFIYGSDTYRSRQKIKAIEAKFLKEVDKQGYNLTRLNGAETTLEKVIDGLTAAPFMATKRMVILEEYSKMSLSDKQEEVFLPVVEAMLERETVFVVWEAELGKRDLKNAFYQVLLTSQYVLSFESWNQQQVAGWMNQELQKNGLAIDPIALQDLSLAVEDNLWKASTEIEKLKQYALANGIKTVDQSTSKLLISGGAHDNIFALVDAVSFGNQKEALKRLHDQLRAGSNELEIVGMLVRQFRILQQIKDGLDQGLRQDGIAQNFGIHPYVVKKMSRQAQSIDQETIVKSYQKLVNVDQNIKSLGLSANLQLSLAVARLSGKN